MNSLKLQVRVRQKYNILPEFVDHLMSYIDPAKIRPMKLVVNAGNGAAGHVIDAIEIKFKELNIPVEFIKIHHEADGNFPNGIPNPILIENRASTRDAVIKHSADMGIAWDGDFDRCFLFDEKGQFIEGYYIVGLLAQAFLLKQAGEKSCMIHVWSGILLMLSNNIKEQLFSRNQDMLLLRMSCVSTTQPMVVK